MGFSICQRVRRHPVGFPEVMSPRLIDNYRHNAVCSFRRASIRYSAKVVILINASSCHYRNNKKQIFWCPDKLGDIGYRPVPGQRHT